MRLAGNWLPARQCALPRMPKRARRLAFCVPTAFAQSVSCWHPDPRAQSLTQMPLHPPAPCDISRNPATLARQALASEYTMHGMLIGWSLLQWPHSDLSPRPSACDADVTPPHPMPLDHTVRANCYSVADRHCLCHAKVSVQGAGYNCLRVSMAG